MTRRGSGDGTIGRRADGRWEGRIRLGYGADGKQPNPMRSLLITGLVVLAGCGSHLPAPECDPNPAFSGSFLTCDAAVAVAEIALPTDHPAIERVQFLYGSATPYTHLLLPEEEEQPVDGYVVFTYSDGSRRQYVPVVWRRDALTAGIPAAY